jgi:hypothetical protein
LEIRVFHPVEKAEVITEQLNFADCANVKIAQGAFLMTLATKLLREYDENAHFGEGQT